MPRGRKQKKKLHGAPGPRPFWSGTISFGLVSVPVALYPGSRSVGVSLRMLAPDGTPLARRYYCPEEEIEISPDEIVRGYEVGDGRFVVVEDDELERLAPEKSRDIDLRRFVPRDDLDPRYFDRAYFLVPAGDSTKAYRLLAAVMERSGRAGIATFVMRGKEYLVALLADDGILRAETLRFPAEVRTPEAVGLPEPGKPSAGLVKAMKAAIEALAEDELAEDELADRRTERLRRLGKEKARAAGKAKAGGGARSRQGRERDGDRAEPPDLMKVLKWSLEGRGREAPGGAGT